MVYFFRFVIRAEKNYHFFEKLKRCRNFPPTPNFLKLKDEENFVPGFCDDHILSKVL